MERVEREWRQVDLAIPSPLPVLLPLEKGLRTLAFAPDHAIKRLGPKPVPGLSRCGVSDGDSTQRGTARG